MSETELLNRYPSSEAPIDTSVVAEVEKGIDKPSESVELNEFIAERAREAMRDCEFESTPELRESIEGFYHDHFFLAGAIKAVAEGRFDSDLMETILEDPRVKDWERRVGRSYPSQPTDRVEPSPNAITAAYRLATMSREIISIQDQLSEQQMREWHVNALKQCGAALGETLFRETSVGISTVGDSEVALAQDLTTQVIEAANASGYYDESSYRAFRFPNPDNTQYLIETSQEAFWGDTRHAGQLLFHGSSNLGAINNRGAMSRNQQLRETGRMNAQTAVNFDGNTMHSVVTHWSEFYGGSQYAGGEKGGTFAIPLVKIIEQAPYARDGKYGLLKPKSVGVLDRVPSATRESTGSSGAGEDDEVSSTGSDRVFFASPDEESDKLPDEYAIEVWDKTRKPATYIERLGKGEAPHGGEITGLGAGYGSPERLFLGPEDDAEAPIRAMQEEYQREFADRGIVVPLRRGVFAQIFENHPTGKEGGRRRARIYNRYTPGSEAA